MTEKETAHIKGTTHCIGCDTPIDPKDCIIVEYTKAKATFRYCSFKCLALAVIEQVTDDAFA